MSDIVRRKYIFVVDDKTDAYDVLADIDLENNPLIELHIAGHKIAKTKVGRMLQRLYFSGKVNYYLPLPFRYWFSKISKYKFLNNTEYVMVVFDGSLGQYDYKIWNKLKRKYSNVHLVLIMWDSYNAQTFFGKMLRRDIKKVKWDYIFSFDRNDAKKHGFKYLNEHYYSDKREVVKSQRKIEHDVYFTSTIKPGKGRKIKEIYEYLRRQGIDCDFKILLRTLEDKRLYASDEKLMGVDFYYQLKPYKKILEELQSSNCILEILQNKQTAPSLRYFEAVMFNKKLLTNNPYIKDLNFYNPKYMKYFEKAEDIDLGWLKSREKVDYGYKDEFSPRYLLEEVRRLYGD